MASAEVLNGQYEYMELTLDSQQATVGLNGYTSLDWPLYKFGYPIGDIAQMKVLEVGFPTVWGSIQSWNNTFTMTIAAVNYTVTIPAGTYTATSFVAALQTALTTAYGLTTWTVTWNPTTFRYTISTAAPAITFSFTFDTSGAATPWRYIGFAPGLNGPYVTSTACPRPPNFSGPNWVYLYSSKIGTFVNCLPGQGTLFDGNLNPIVAKIPVTVGPNEFNVWQDPSPDLWFNMDALYNLSEVDFYLMSPELQLLQMAQGWYVKVGILYRNTSVAQERSSQNVTNRVIKRIRPQ